MKSLYERLDEAIENGEITEEEAREELRNAENNGYEVER
jgi:hypothetical protein